MIGTKILAESAVGKKVVDSFNDLIGASPEVENDKKLDYKVTGQDLANAIKDLPLDIQNKFLDYQFDIQTAELKNEEAKIKAHRDIKMEMEKTDRANGIRPKIALAILGLITFMIGVVTFLYLDASSKGMTPEDMTILKFIIDHLFKTLESYFSTGF